MRLLAAPCLALLIGVATLPAAAYDWGYQVRGGYVHSDNVAQAPTGDAANILVTEVNAALQHTTRTLMIDGEANYAYRRFLDDGLGGEHVPQLRAAIDWAPYPEHLRFSVTDVYGQSAFNPSEGLLPSDYENTNVLTAGPTLLWPVAQNTQLQLRGEYRRADFERSPVDTRRQMGEARLAHDLTQRITLFGGGGTSRTEADVEGSASKYDVDSAFLGFDAVGRRSALLFEAGLEVLRRDGDSMDGSRYDLTYERQLGRSSRLFVSATREIADAADVFSLSQASDTALAAVGDVQPTVDPFVRTAYRLGYVLSGRRLGFAVSGGRREEDYRNAASEGSLTTGVDRKIDELLLNASYLWDPQMSMEMRAEVLQERFDTGASSDDLLLGVSCLRQVSPRLRFDIELQRIERSNSPRNFDEMRLMLFLTYSGRNLERSVSAFDRAFERRVERARGSQRDRGQPEGEDAEIPRDEAEIPASR